MKTLNIVEFCPHGSGIFAKFLIWLSQRNSWGWSLQCHSQFSWDLFKEAGAVIVDTALSAEVLAKVRTSTTLVRSLECVDTFFFEGGAWYPRILIWEALREVLIAEARDLDIRAPAFVVGDAEVMRLVASVFAVLGFQDVFMIGKSAQIKEQKSILGHSHFGINFRLVDVGELTEQAVSAGIIVNTTDLSQQKSLLADLSYFNFMKSGGYVLDLNLLPPENLLLDEAEKASLRVLRPVLVFAALTRLWLDRQGIAEELSSSDLAQLWEIFQSEFPK